MTRTAPAPNVPPIPGMCPGVAIASGGGDAGGGTGKAGKKGKGKKKAKGKQKKKGAKGGRKGACGRGAGKDGGGCPNHHGSKASGAVSKGDPVDVTTGRVFTVPVVEVDLPGPLPFRLERSYTTSARGRDVGFGHGWSHGLSWELEVRRRSIIVRGDEGIEVEFPAIDGTTAAVGGEGNLLFLRDGRYVVDRTDAPRLIFGPSARARHHRLEELADVHGNRIVLRYDERGLAEVVDAVGRILRLRRREDGLVEALELDDPMIEGMRIEVARYLYEGRDLVAAFNALGSCTRYTYAPGHLLSCQIGPNGVAFHYRYDDEGRCVETWGTLPAGGSVLGDGVPEVLADGSPAKGILHCKLSWFPDGTSEVIDCRGPSLRGQRPWGLRQGRVGRGLHPRLRRRRRGRSILRRGCPGGDQEEVRERGAPRRDLRRDEEGLRAHGEEAEQARDREPVPEVRRDVHEARDRGERHGPQPQRQGAHHAMGRTLDVPALTRHGLAADPRFAEVFDRTVPRSAVLEDWVGRGGGLAVVERARGERIAVEGPIWLPIFDALGTVREAIAYRFLLGLVDELQGRPARHLEELRGSTRELVGYERDAPLILILDGIEAAVGWREVETTFGVLGANVHLVLGIAREARATIDANWTALLARAASIDLPTAPFAPSASFDPRLLRRVPAMIAPDRLDRARDEIGASAFARWSATPFAVTGFQGDVAWVIDAARGAVVQDAAAAALLAEALVVEAAVVGRAVETEDAAEEPLLAETDDLGKVVRATAAWTLAEHAPEPERSRLLEAARGALETLRGPDEIDDPALLGELLLATARSDAEVTRAIEVLRRADDLDHDVDALRGLLRAAATIHAAAPPHRCDAGALVDEVVVRARALAHGASIDDLVEAVPPSEVARFVAALGDNPAEIAARAQLARNLDANARRTVLADACTLLASPIHGPVDVDRLAAAIAPELTDPQRTELLAARPLDAVVASLEDEHARVEALAASWDHFDPERIFVIVARDPVLERAFGDRLRRSFEDDERFALRATLYAPAATLALVPRPAIEARLDRGDDYEQCAGATALARATTDDTFARALTARACAAFARDPDVEFHRDLLGCAPFMTEADARLVLARGLGRSRDRSLRAVLLGPFGLLDVRPVYERLLGIEGVRALARAILDASRFERAAISPVS
jgi:hypothetical protein